MSDAEVPALLLEVSLVFECGDQLVVLELDLLQRRAVSERPDAAC